MSSRSYSGSSNSRSASRARPVGYPARITTRANSRSIPRAPSSTSSPTSIGPASDSSSKRSRRTPRRRNPRRRGRRHRRTRRRVALGDRSAGRHHQLRPRLSALLRFDRYRAPWRRNGGRRLRPAARRTLFGGTRSRREARQRSPATGKRGNPTRSRNALDRLRVRRSSLDSKTTSTTFQLSRKPSRRFGATEAPPSISAMSRRAASTVSGNSSSTRGMSPPGF